MDLLGTRQVDPVHQSPQTRAYGFFAKGTVPSSLIFTHLVSFLFLSGDRLLHGGSAYGKRVDYLRPVKLLIVTVRRKKFSSVRTSSPMTSTLGVIAGRQRPVM